MAARKKAAARKAPAKKAAAHPPAKATARAKREGPHPAPVANPVRGSAFRSED